MATKQEKEVAKQKAIKGGMPSDVANNVFRMQMGKDKSGIDSGHAFPMKQAYTIRMSPMLQTKNEDGTTDVESYNVQLPGGTLGTETVSTTTETIPGQTTTRKKTWDDLRAEGFTEEQIKEAKAWRKSNPDVKNVGVAETTPDQTVETQTISVGDTENPVIVGVPADLSAECEAIPAIPNNVTATDNCDTDVQLDFEEITKNDGGA